MQSEDGVATVRHAEKTEIHVSEICFISQSILTTSGGVACSRSFYTSRLRDFVNPGEEHRLLCVIFALLRARAMLTLTNVSRERQWDFASKSHVRF